MLNDDHFYCLVRTSGNYDVLMSLLHSGVSAKPTDPALYRASAEQFCTYINNEDNIAALLSVIDTSSAFQKSPPPTPTKIARTASVPSPSSSAFFAPQPQLHHQSPLSLPVPVAATSSTGILSISSANAAAQAALWE